MRRTNFKVQVSQRSYLWTTNRIKQLDPECFIRYLLQQMLNFFLFAVEWRWLYSHGFKSRVMHRTVQMHIYNGNDNATDDHLPVNRGFGRIDFLVDDTMFERIILCVWNKNVWKNNVIPLFVDIKSNRITASYSRLHSYEIRPFILTQTYLEHFKQVSFRHFEALERLFLLRYRFDQRFQVVVIIGSYWSANQILDMSRFDLTWAHILILNNDLQFCKHGRILKIV